MESKLIKPKVEITVHWPEGGRSEYGAMVNEVYSEKVEEEVDLFFKKLRPDISFEGEELTIKEGLTGLWNKFNYEDEVGGLGTINGKDSFERFMNWLSK